MRVYFLGFGFSYVLGEPGIILWLATSLVLSGSHPYN